MKAKVVAFVPIKLNSERLPRKNLLQLGNQPLCYHIFESLLEVEGIDEIFVYCSDEIVMDYLPRGIKLLKRSESLDLNETKGMEIYKSFINKVQSDVYILAHATSPFIKSKSIKEGLEAVISGEHDSALSVEKLQTFAWYDGKPLNYKLEDIPRTQDIDPIYIETSGFFVFERSIIKDYSRRIGFNPYLKEVDKIEAIDIDTREDFEFAEKMIAYKY